MFHELVHNTLNQQINAELQAWYDYLGMASWCSRQQLHGCEHWLRAQSQEEYMHAMKLFQFLLDRNLKVNMSELKPPRNDFENVAQAFEAALTQEEENTRRIHNIFDIALQQKAFTSVVELQWFITEQVEEMRIARDNFTKARMVSGDPGALLEFDRMLGQRQKNGTTEA